MDLNLRRWTIFLFFLALAGAAVAGPGAVPATAMSGHMTPPLLPAPPDSGSAGKPAEFQPGNWDSVLAAYDSSIKPDRHVHLSPEYDLHYSKAEGVHVEGGFSAADPPVHLSHLEGRFGYDLGRGRPTALGFVLLPIDGQEKLSLELAGHDEAVAFGNDQPYGNTVMALFDGYDTRQYMRERELRAMLIWNITTDRQLGGGWVRVRQDPLPVAARWHLFGADHWMDHNEAAQHLVGNGIRLRFLRRPPYQGETVKTGLVAKVEATTFGGGVLGGGQEFSTGQADVWYTAPVRQKDAWHLRASASISAGRAPRQAWQDLGGAAGLKAFPPRGFGTPDTLIGLARFFVRAEYQHPQDLLFGLRLPLVGPVKAIMVPFAEVGSAWGGRPLHQFLTWGDLDFPGRRDLRWDLGFGLRRDIDFAGLLSHAQLDFAWPMGAQRGPARITLLLSRNWLD